MPDCSELHIIINSKPKAKITVWRILVTVDAIKKVIANFREINWLYKEVDKSVNSAAKEVIEVVSNTTSNVLEKASKGDVSGFQSYTIRNLDKIWAVNLIYSSTSFSASRRIHFTIDNVISMSCAFPCYFQMDSLESIIPMR